MIYVPNLYGSSVSVINGTCGVVGTIALPIGSKPYAAAYDPPNKDIYVTDGAHPVVYVIHNLTRIHVIHNASFTGGTWSIAWDPSANMMLCVALHGLLVGISGTSINGSIHVGNSYSEGMAFDSRANEMLITNYAHDNVTGVNASHPFTGAHRSILVGNGPAGIGSDPATGYVYVANYQGKSVSVINGNGSYLGTIRVGSGPVGVAFDPAKKEVFVANRLSNNVSVISGLSVVRTLSSFPSPNNYLFGAVYDPATKLVYVTAENYKVFIVS
ncbi:MAG TPA: YncE family protein [Thermoplasmata archaeon]|nr:YncE family protein [Thermoplasmata archaeon]